MSLGKKRMEEEAAGEASGADSEANEKDEDERELEKLEKQDPEMLRICTTILEQLERFKVGSRLGLTTIRIFNLRVCIILTIHLCFFLLY